MTSFVLCLGGLAVGCFGPDLEPLFEGHRGVFLYSFAGKVKLL